MIPCSPNSLEPVKLGVLVSKRGNPRPMIGLRRRDTLDEGDGSIALAVAMDVIAQPGEELAKLTPREGLVQTAEHEPSTPSSRGLRTSSS